MTAMISVARGNALVDIQRFGSVDTDGRARITASKGVRYMLTDAEGGSAASTLINPSRMRPSSAA